MLLHGINMIEKVDMPDYRDAKNFGIDTANSLHKPYTKHSHTKTRMEGGKNLMRKKPRYSDGSFWDWEPMLMIHEHTMM